MPFKKLKKGISKHQLLLFITVVVLTGGVLVGITVLLLQIYGNIPEDEPRSDPKLLYNASIYNNEKENGGVEGTIFIYSSFPLSSPKNISFHVSIDLSKHPDVSTMIDVTMMACFTDNLHSFEQNLEQGMDAYNSTNKICLENIDRKIYPFMLPSTFVPENYGAVSIIATNGISSLSLGNLIYAKQSQKSIYPNLTTELEQTTELYKISGSIEINGRVKRKSTGKIIDIPEITFHDIKMSPQPPNLFLYLTTRSAWMRFGENDIFIQMDTDESDPDFPQGSFSRTGTFTMDWPFEGSVNIIDFIDGYWYLWCETFTVTLAGGPITIVK